jgi:tetratricopeptide (TPR) repeat protein
LTALAELARFTLVTRQETQVSVHRLVQEVVRSRIPAQSRAAWVEKAVRLVNDFAPRPPDDVRTWPVWDPLRPHAMRVIELAEAENVEQPVSTLMNELAVLLKTKGIFSQAKPLYRRALTLDERAFGNDHPEVARDLNNLAQLLKATNRLAEAEPLMRRALDVFTRSLGEDHPNTQLDARNLAILLEDLASPPVE